MFFSIYLFFNFNAGMKLFGAVDFSPNEKTSRDCFYKCKNEEKITYHESIKIDCIDLNFEKKGDCNRSQIDSASVEIE